MVQKIFTYILCFSVLFGIFSVEKIFANSALQCPNFSNIKLTADEVVSKIDSCIAARNAWNPASITEFNCMAGEFWREDGQTLTSDRLAYHITVNLFFNESDKLMKEYMQNLSRIRNKNPTEWLYEYNSCILGKGGSSEKSLSYFYDSICQFSYVSDFLNSHSGNAERKFLQNSDGYPQELCNQLSAKKKESWQNLGNLLMAQWIIKSYQNDRDYYMSGVQGQYRSIIEKFHNYQKIIFRAVSKMTHYVKNQSSRWN